MLYLLMQFHHTGWGFIHCFGNTCYLVLYKLGYPDTLHGFLYSIIYSLIQSTYIRSSASWVAQVSKESTCDTGDIGDTSSVPGLGRSPGGEHGNPLQYSCLEWQEYSWRIPWTKKLGGLQFIGLQRVRHDWSDWTYKHAGSSLLGSRH